MHHRPYPHALVDEQDDPFESKGTKLKKYMIYGNSLIQKFDSLPQLPELGMLYVDPEK